MVPITFTDRKTEKRALAFLLGRFSGRVLHEEREGQRPLSAGPLSAGDPLHHARSTPLE
jgi:hypothetical protein